MIELVFVIVILGILAAVAIPRFAATRTDAQIAKGRSDIASVRSGIIAERQSRLFRGQTNFIATLDANDGFLFNNILTYPITAGAAGVDGDWIQNSATTYTFTIAGNANNFQYCDTNITAVSCNVPGAGTFNCVAGANCGDLTN